MRYYKQACEFDETRVHKDFSVIGSEFCSFLFTVYRLIKEYEKAGLLGKMTYKKILRILTRAKKVCLDEKTWHLIKMNPSITDRIVAGAFTIAQACPEQTRQASQSQCIVLAVGKVLIN